ncbi:hypothetical protein EVAR_5885_1 [Eumeta japonica]|uniref:Uncharacterized protein n=1 Tax=Eumeta variegata TaxID=151549 RepID=A0A4C1TEP8_EUMVA|nr:hypothetical protein EVAR_5885_1 [Eumeta japonica]
MRPVTQIRSYKSTQWEAVLWCNAQFVNASRESFSPSCYWFFEQRDESGNTPDKTTASVSKKRKLIAAAGPRAGLGARFEFKGIPKTSEPESKLIKKSIPNSASSVKKRE